MGKIRVLLTDDHTLFRQGIRTLLSAEPDIEVAAEAAKLHVVNVRSIAIFEYEYQFVLRAI